jgi:hypothetical protein
MKACHSDALAAPAMQASDSQRGNGSHNADRTAANPHVQASRLSGARRCGEQKQAGHTQNDDSNKEFRHGTLAADFCETRTPDGTKSSVGDEPGSNAGSTSWLQANPEGNRLMHIVQGLIIADPWTGCILDGSKTWEMRSSPRQVCGAFS